MGSCSNDDELAFKARALNFTRAGPHPRICQRWCGSGIDGIHCAGACTRRCLERWLQQLADVDLSRLMKRLLHRRWLARRLKWETPSVGSLLMVVRSHWSPDRRFRLPNPGFLCSRNGSRTPAKDWQRFVSAEAVVWH